MATAPGYDADPMVSVLAEQIEQFGTWDPELSVDWVSQNLEDITKRRIKQDVYDTKFPSGCYVEPDSTNYTLVHVLITGPVGTPYEGGFFYFLVRFPPNYPAQPPRVKIMTGNNTVRFNPNLYKDGKVCLSLLGTWNRSSWTPAHCLFTILESIQGVMNKEPYHNEPDLSRLGKVEGHSERYSDFVCYETLRTAVCGMIETPHPKLPASLRSKIQELFMQKFEFYKSKISEKKHLDRQMMMVDTYGNQKGTFNFKGVKKRLLAIHEQISNASTEDQTQ
ncbi:ubiquitin-conjugating enzyme E2 Z-like [Apostichopus japonicus]|uniref:ubiquitin-conjugating enzyme E2 Z-like n=1 Tax=Stichopus japonicus TaxID=307972 RepID=UPI003AB31EBE